MLNIIKAPLDTAAPISLLERIKSITENKKRSYLIVPEQETVMREAAMSNSLPGYSPLYFEVTNFTRLANSVFRTLGGISGEYCDKNKRALIMWRTLTELSHILTVTSGRRDISAKLVESMTIVVKELESAGITPEELADAARDDQISRDRRLLGKLSDLSAIYALYKKLLCERYVDTGSDVEMMIRKLEEHKDFLCDYEIFIDGFTSFTEPQYKLIGLISARCRVNVYLPLAKGCEDAFEYTETAEAIEKLKRAARRAEADVKISAEPISPKKKSYTISDIKNYFWRKSANNVNIDLQNTEEIRIFEAQTPFEECDFLASDIKRRVMGGASYSDFAIIARDAESYSGILDTSLRDASIPHFFSTHKDASALEGIKLIYTAYSIARTGFAREDVLTYAKCGLAGISRRACDEFETYVNTWQINGKRFTDGTVWNMNPLGYTARRPEGTDELLRRIHETKLTLISPLEAFFREMSAAKTVRAHAEALLTFLININLEASLKERSTKLASLGELAYAEENERLWGLICDTLDVLVEVTGDMEADSEAFLGQLKTVISGTEIGRIPSFADEVIFGSADMLRLHGKKHIYLIGVNAGEFPAAPSDSSFFSERDKAALSALGLAISPEMEKKNARELFIFSRAFAFAEESVTLMYSGTNTKFKATEPAGVIARIAEITAGRVVPVRISNLPAIERIYSAEAALRESSDKDPMAYEAISDALKKSGHSEALRISEAIIENTRMELGEDICRELYSKPIGLTQTRLDTFLGCPLAYFCKYTVNLGEERLAELDASGVGSFIHAILENFFKSLSVSGRSPADLSPEDRAELTRRSAEKYVAALGEDITGSSPITKIKLNRLCRAATPVIDELCKEFGVSKFEPTFFELNISRDSDLAPDPISLKTESGKRVSVYGIIDRVDTYKKDDKVFVRVVDYKTGKKEFSPEDMKEGENLQMFLYLKAILDSEKEKFREACGAAKGDYIVPAGVLYVKTSVSDVRVDTPSDTAAIEAVKANQKREGMILADDEIISAMGLEYTPLYSSRTPDKIPDSKKKYMFSEEGFSEIMETVEGATKSLAERISSGDARAIPKIDKHGSTKCEYCKFKPICRAAIIK